jgi:hypothetical protein
LLYDFGWLTDAISFAKKATAIYESGEGGDSAEGTSRKVMDSKIIISKCMVGLNMDEESYDLTEKL